MRWQLGLLILLISFGVSAQKVYKWVDENGTTHYTTTPPENQQAETLALKNRKPAPTEPVQSDVEHDDGQHADAETQTSDGDGDGETDGEAEEEETYLEKVRREREELAEAAEERKQRRERCEKARRALSFYQTHPRVDEMTEDGTARRLPDQERQERMQGAQDAVRKFCGPG